MRRLDSTQIIALYQARLREGEFYTPQLVNPVDIVNYYMYVGYQIAAEAEKNGNRAEAVIRYALASEGLPPIQHNASNEPILLPLVEETIKKHQQVFRTTLSRIRADYRADNKQLVQFKSRVISAYQLPANPNVIVYAWNFKLSTDVNKTIATLGADIMVIE